MGKHILSLYIPPVSNEGELGKVISTYNKEDIVKVLQEHLDSDKKFCKTCNTVKSITDFPSDERRKLQKHYFRCKECVNKKAREYYNKIKDLPETKEKQREKDRKRKLRKKGVDIPKNKPSEKIKSYYNRSKYLFNKFGITEEDYKLLLEKQDGKCSICKVVLENKYPNIDHCHTTGKVRGILCNCCNRGLGYFKDNEDIMYSAIIYIQNSRDSKLLEYINTLLNG